MSSYSFNERHIGPGKDDLPRMLEKIGVSSLDELIDKTIPSSIRLAKKPDTGKGMSEAAYLERLREIASKNQIFRSYIGQGYYDTYMPAVIQRNMLENPAWYTSYTPYQAEISQGRLEALLNFQTVVSELTGLEIANASLLDEGTAAAEAMIMMYNLRSREAVKRGANVFLADENMFRQTLDVMHTRAVPLGIDLRIIPASEFEFSDRVFGVMVQYPAANGEIRDYRPLVEKAHQAEVLVGVAADILSLAILVPPGEWGADVAVGSTQRFGIPMGYGGPHAAYFATHDKFKRSIPGRIIGVSVDRMGNKALRMALQTREQHIKRERATSNICTAQALLASMAGMYAVYHGQKGLKQIALRIHSLTAALRNELIQAGYAVQPEHFFDTLHILLPDETFTEKIRNLALERKMNFFYPSAKEILLSLDETTTVEDVNEILEIFGTAAGRRINRIKDLREEIFFDVRFRRTTPFLQHELFTKYRSETSMMRYIKQLERKDFSLADGMIPLGSCTMKLNAAVEMLPLSWPELGRIHPFAPLSQTEGYQQIFHELGKDLLAITGFSGITFQPNSGAAGEYTGLLIIRKYHETRGEAHRNVVLIPSSAHGTNPASAAMAGMEVVVVQCDELGNVDVSDLRSKAEQHRQNLAAFMITYPSTHGVFESRIKEMNDIVHQNGGLVYMDGANMNAQVGLTSPAAIGADLCHLNLHKTFAIPHGGGGPGVGPVAVADHLVEFLPGHSIVPAGGKNGITPVSSAPYGNANVVVISHAYCRMMGTDGLTDASRYAILNANYLAACLNPYFPVLYKGEHGFVGHEMILDLRQFKQETGITELDIAKRLLDYGFHSPTVSFPVHGTLMVEPTESEPIEELDRFVEAMIAVWHELDEIRKNPALRNDNLLKNAPHTAEECTSDNWNHPYSRSQAAFPVARLKTNKFWPSVARVDDAYGDRNLVCTCLPVSAYAEKA
ncbi:MAG TPA: aminomethyl-transferring glycine dehydrogenase [Bacteroidales bacterium]|nr:aminomethyl-transferring glycine dehydrogenase [Bacteroidales bacterium]